MRETEILLLQAVRLKGRMMPGSVGDCTEIPDAEAEVELDRLLEAGHLERVGSAFKLTDAGRDRLAEVLAAERETLDQGRLATLYDAFCDVNGEVKEVVTAWQMKDEQTPNDHQDEDYDAGVARRLLDLHDRVRPIVGDVATAVPRLGAYARRLQAAADGVEDGDRRFIASPLLDSYHTVWFELHEELIGALGRTRLEEAAAGRAL